MKTATLLIVLYMVSIKPDLGSCTDDSEQAISLTFQNESATCVNQRYPHHKYCLSWKQTIWQLAKERGYRCYLQKKLVYDCMPNGRCTDHGILLGNTRPLVVAQDCHGVPFANIVNGTAGNFICIIENNGRRIQASFDLDVCEEHIEDFKVEFLLEFHKQPTTCIDPLNLTGYCLSPRLNGEAVNNRAFRIYMDDHLVYNCMKHDECKDFGKLRNHTLKTTKECVGIKYDTFQQDFKGTYTVVIEDESLLLQAKHSLHNCKDVAHNIGLKTGWWIYPGIGVAIAAVVIVSVLVFYWCLRRRKKESYKGTSDPAEQRPLDEKHVVANI